MIDLLKRFDRPLPVLHVLCTLGITVSCHPGGHPTTQTSVNVPKAWQASSKSSSRTISTGWVRDFNDPTLSKLIDEAMTHNPDLLATAQRLEAARANVVRARSRRLPSADIRAGSSRSRSENDGPHYASNHELSLGASWEIDLWGRLRHLHSAAEADYESTVADFRGTRLSLAASTASAWFQLITNESQTKLSEETLSRYNKVARIIERNYKAGTARSLDLQLSRNNVYNEERTLQGRRRNRDDAKRNLEILLGRYPKAALQAPSDLPNFRKNIPAGIPADIINRRPDLVRARQRLLASFHRAKAAQKNLLPAIRLTGNSGIRSPQISDLFNIDNLASSISGSLTQSLFEGDALREEARAEVAKNRASIYDFANVALRAFREVESNLAAEEFLAKEEKFQKKSLRQAELAEKQAGRDYAEGVAGTSILDLLEAQRRASNARDALIVIRNQRLQNRINLHLALGGDFKTPAQ
jgi:NodT family efflux transporter outer membrane factor (OMF) lipoprotein